MTAHTTQTAVGLRRRIREIVAEELELELAELDDSADFVDDYDADSLSLITVVSRIEKELDVAVPKSELENLTNLEQVFAAVEQYAAPESGRV